MSFLVLSLLLYLWTPACAAPPPMSMGEDSAAPLEIIRQGRNQTRLSNDTLGSPANEYFPDPYDFVIEAKGLTIEFYGYRDEVKYADLDNCMQRVNDEVKKEVKAGRAQSSMGLSPYVYFGGQVMLFLSPGEHLTWSKWSLAPPAMKRFLLENGLKGTQFILLWHGLGPVGNGHIVAMSETRSSIKSTSSTAPNVLPGSFDRHLDVLNLTM